MKDIVKVECPSLNSPSNDDSGAVGDGTRLYSCDRNRYNPLDAQNGKAFNYVPTSAYVRDVTIEDKQRIEKNNARVADEAREKIKN